MAFDIKINKLKWGDIKLVCACGGIEGKKNSFELSNIKNIVYYTCVNPECNNKFTSEIQIKALTKLEQWLDEHKDNPEGFAHYFRVKDNSMRLRYIKTEVIDDKHKYYVIEVTNLTTMPQYKNIVK